ncbi:hypothetical protein SLS62_006706 [Diatrype stigma]|uniref:Uncharacterized protein n=1 Tax=Diatrype stigma TaxID=117547 RepID=A0AAN9US31_9PEZI
MSNIECPCLRLIAMLVDAIGRTAQPGGNNSGGGGMDGNNIKDDSDSELECRALKERDVNLPSKLPPTTTLSSEP